LSNVASLPAHSCLPFAPQTRYIKGDSIIPVPRSIEIEESRRMGQFDFTAVSPLAQRPVPASPRDYVRARSAYAEAMSATRKAFRAEWDARRERVAAAKAAHRDSAKAATAASRAARAARHAANAAAHAVRLAQTREARRLRKGLTRRSNELLLAQIDERRQAWLDALEADAAKRWVPPDRIDEVRRRRRRRHRACGSWGPVCHLAGLC
jgi:hypothetical protein